MTAISMLINGERVQATGGATFERRNPLDGSVATTAPAASVADAKAAADAAAKAFPAWSAPVSYTHLTLPTIYSV